MDKSQMRSQIRKSRAHARTSTTDEAWHSRGLAISEAVCKEPVVAAACSAGATIAAYASYGTEPPTDALIENLSKSGARVILPVIVDPTAPLHWAVADPNLVPDERGIPTPTAHAIATNPNELLALGCAVILVPALAVSTNGERLGQGGGYYDRLLAALPRYPDGPYRISVVSADEVLPELPTEPHDELIDSWLTC